jgi:hypothetical protein
MPWSHWTGVDRFGHLPLLDEIALQSSRASAVSMIRPERQRQVDPPEDPQRRAGA